MTKIGVAARTMNDVDMMPAQQPGIAVREQVHVGGDQIFTKHLVAGKMFHGRA